MCALRTPRYSTLAGQEKLWPVAEGQLSGADGLSNLPVVFARIILTMLAVGDPEEPQSKKYEPYLTWLPLRSRSASNPLKNLFPKSPPTQDHWSTKHPRQRKFSEVSLLRTRKNKTVKHLLRIPRKSEENALPSRRKKKWSRRNVCFLNTKAA
ncbi:hypothetical protein AVEN_66318-1 [Araneus ventricosus]|uniref:Uncharacterized protein n=1 Tax=Araneus ventricosus TaxID=182803 RepID=A0A4Y2QF54_ARAVE|nr:hypothetical protein AVEN_66318-1 [Araneus ventricosus]